MSDRLKKNVHEHLDSPGDSVCVTRGDFLYYHYGCDGVDDRGWGCGYRTMQSMCSWAENQKKKQGCTVKSEVPSISDIQQALVAMEDKPKDFIGSKMWIGSFEICLCMDYFYDVPCKIIHVTSGADLNEHIVTLCKHFEEYGSPIMMGGDTDNSSKGVLGVCLQPKALLIMDPHHYGDVSDVTELYQNKMVMWRKLDTFYKDSFYNICLPQLKAS